MKKIITLLLCACLCFLIGCKKPATPQTPTTTPTTPTTPAGAVHSYLNGICQKCGAADPDYTPHPQTQSLAEVGGGKYVLADMYGNYGGTRNSVLYGEGAPRNGQYDVPDDTYYTVNDFYNMRSTQYRTIYTHFAPYQQTMENTSGLACMVAVLHYWGVDVTTETEVELLKKYESLNNTTLYGSRETAEGLKTLWEAYGGGQDGLCPGPGQQG